MGGDSVRRGGVKGARTEHDCESRHVRLSYRVTLVSKDESGNVSKRHSLPTECCEEMVGLKKHSAALM